MTGHGADRGGVTITAEPGIAHSYTYHDESHVITTGWKVWADGGWADIVDAPTRGKALFGSSCWGESDHDSLTGMHVRRCPEVDGLTFADARYVVWPCKERPCPGCPCCEDGYCHDR